MSEPSPSERIHAISRRDRATLAQIALAEQARIVDRIDAEARAAATPARRIALIDQRDERNLAWGEIALWLTMGVVPDRLDAALRIATHTADRADTAWQQANNRRTGHPLAVHWFGLWMIARMLTERFAPAQPDLRQNKKG